MEERWVGVGRREVVNVSKCQLLSATCIRAGKAWVMAAVASRLDAADSQSKIQLSSAVDYSSATEGRRHVADTYQSHMTATGPRHSVKPTSIRER